MAFPLGDETNTLVLYGFAVVLALLAAYSMRERRHPVLAGTAAAILGTVAYFAVLELGTLLFHGTNGFQTGTWFAFFAIGLIPAAGLGLVEGIVASLVFRLFAERPEQA